MGSNSAQAEYAGGVMRRARRAVRVVAVCLSMGPAIASAEEVCEPPDEEVVALADVDEPPAVAEAHGQADPRITTDVTDILAEQRFRFCHEDGYRLWPHEKAAYCDQVEALAARCPELRRACERPAWGTVEEESWDFDFGWMVDWIPAAGEILRILFWLVLAVGVGLLLRALVRNLTDEMRRRRRRTELAFTLEEAPIEEAPSTAETDVQRLLHRAREEAARGDLAAGVGSAYAAALRTLERRSLLELHRSRTNGDYLRQLGAHPEERDRLRRIVREVETVQFGRGVVDQSRFDRVLQQVLALVSQAACWCLLVASPFFLTACDSTTIPEAPFAATGPDGHALLESLLQRHTASAQRRYRRLTGSLAEVSTFVALSPNLRDEEWDHLMEWVANGGILLAARVPPPLASRLGLSTEDVSTEDGPPQREPATIPCSAPLVAPGYDLVQSHAHAFADLPNTTPFVACGGAPFLAGMDYGDGIIYALADDVWLRNVNLGAADNASYLVHLTTSPDSRVELIGPWTGSGTHHPFQSIHNAGLSPWLLHLLLLALAYGLSRGVRFRTPVEPEREHRRAFVEHAEALADQYARSRASGHALEQYGRWALERIRERVPVRDRDLHSLAHAVARRTGGEPLTILKILVEAQSAGQIQGAPEEHLAIMESLSRILRDVGGAYGGSPSP